MRLESITLGRLLRKRDIRAVIGLLIVSLKRIKTITARGTVVSNI
jgi:hypothetical protein